MNKTATSPFKILIVEDNTSDIDLIQRTLKKSELVYTSEVVETLEEFTSALESFKPDIILSDYSLPSFNGLEAFHIKADKFPDIPFIIVSGTIGEENAVDLIKGGVNDYVLKEKLVSLPIKIKRALKDEAEKKEKKIIDKKLNRLNRLYSFISQINQNIVRVTDEVELFHNACSIAVEFGKFKMAWIGMFDAGGEKITLVAQSGIAEDDIKLFTHAPYLANGPQDYVLRSGTYYICNDVKGNVEVEEWKLLSDSYNINSCMVLPIKRSGQIIGTLNLYAQNHDFVESEEIKLLVEAAGDISFALDRFEKARIQKATEDLLVKNEKKFHHTLNNMMEGAQIHDFDWRYLYVNDTLVSYSTYTREELMGHTLMEKYPGIEQTELFKTLERCMTDRVGQKFETEFVFPNGTKADFELSIEPIPEGIFILSVDHTERKRAKEKLLKANRLYAFLSAINQSIVHTSDKDELLNNACNIAVGVGQFLMAWIDMIDDETGNLNTVSHQGKLTSVLETKKTAGMDYTSALLRGTPTGKVLGTGKYAISNDVENDPALKLWLKELAAKGIRSTISLPITRFGKVIGVFGFHSSKINFFDAEEIALLEEAASDVSYALEILERKRIFKITEELVASNEKRFRALIEQGADMITLSNINGRMLYGSPSITKVLGYENNEFLQMRIFDVIHPDDIHYFVEKRNAAVQIQDDSFDHEMRVRHKNGNWIWCAGTFKNMMNDPSVNALVSNFKDITDRKSAEQQQEFDKNNLNALINNTNDLMWSVDRDFNLITSNLPFEEMSKINFGRIVEKGSSVLSTAYTPEMLNHFKLQYERAFAGEAYTETEHFTIPFEFWTEVSYYPIRKGDEIIGTACQSHDITQIKKAEKQLIKSEQHNRALIENITDAIVLINKSAEVIYQSSSVERISGYNIEELKGKSIFEFIHPADLNSCLDLFQQAYARPGIPIQSQYRIITNTGNYIWIEGTIMNLLHDENVNAFIINYRDINERKKSETALAQTEKLLAEAQSLAKIGNWNFDVFKNELYWSDSLRSIYGVNPEYQTGNIQDSMSIVYQEDRERTWNELMQASKTGEELNNTYRILRPDTNEVRTLRATTDFELDSDGKVVRMYGIAEDITELNNAQQERDNTLLELEQRVIERTKELFDKNTNINDSINYAKRLQKSLFPDIQKLKRLFKNSFLMSCPSDIVGGDFLWFSRSRKKILVACVDCTGHSVPGAFMSIIGIQLLNKIIVDQDWKYPSLILELMDDGIMSTLTEKKGDIIQDGMDMSFCMIDTESNKIFYAGAQLPVIITRKGKGIVHTPSRFGIGKYMDSGKKRFETKEIDYLEGDMLYMFSDGFRDQFGGEKNKKLGLKSFLQLLEDVSLLDTEEQKEELNRRFVEWKGINNQVDDVLVVGIEL